LRFSIPSHNHPPPREKRSGEKGKEKGRIPKEKRGKRKRELHPFSPDSALDSVAVMRGKKEKRREKGRGKKGRRSARCLTNRSVEEEEGSKKKKEEYWGRREGEGHLLPNSFPFWKPEKGKNGEKF